MSIQNEALGIARAWLGTPYHHQASKKHVGCDCLGLVRGIWRELYDTEPEIAPPYTADWSEASREETLWDAARRNLIEIDWDEVVPGDVILFRMAQSHPAKHVGVLSGSDRFIHAYSNRAVTENALSRWWEAKRVACFTWPDRHP